MVVCCKCNKTGRCRGCALASIARIVSLNAKTRNLLHPRPVTLTLKTHPTMCLLTLKTHPIMCPAPPPRCQRPRRLQSETCRSLITTDPRSTTFDPRSFESPAPTFVWGSLSSTDSLDECYDKVVHWKPNLFKLPLSSSGKAFVFELSKLMLMPHHQPSRVWPSRPPSYCHHSPPETI